MSNGLQGRNQRPQWQAQSRHGQQDDDSPLHHAYINCQPRHSSILSETALFWGLPGNHPQQSALQVWTPELHFALIACPLERPQWTPLNAFGAGIATDILQLEPVCLYRKQ